MHEILEHLPQTARVLDLGCREGSFADAGYPFLTVRVDFTRPKEKMGRFVQADAIRLPFRSRTFDAVILNHTVEHFVQLKPALQEIGRVIKSDGAACVTVPDATTVTDRLYRKVARNRGGHVNLFDSAADLEKMLAWYLGLPHVATRILFSSFIFLNWNNLRDPVARRQMRFGGVGDPLVAAVSAGTRLWDRLFRTRTRIYGWAFYFGRIGEPVDLRPVTNVCVRCGQAHPARMLEEAGRVRRALLWRSYRCPDCGAFNFLLRDGA